MNIINYFFFFKVIQFLIQTIFHLNFYDFTLCPYIIVNNFQIYRIFSSLFIYLSFFNFLINIVCIQYISTYLTKFFNKKKIILLILFSIILSQFIFILISLLCYILFNNNLLLFSQTYGLNAPIISLIHLFGNLYNTNINIGGIYNINSKYLSYFNIVINCFLFNNYNIVNLILNISGLLTGIILLKFDIFN